ncbi:unannotated protein [freshwater metagenome]|uniref:Unannotated protein n=1 Tax=freshwater metagenome TaxID=449393 RepID=A0A6J6Q5L0_9ZZZZ
MLDALGFPLRAVAEDVQASDQEGLYLPEKKQSRRHFLR